MSAGNEGIDFRAPEHAPEHAAYWAATREHRLVAQRCRSCHQWQWPPQDRCRACASSDLEWGDLPEEGELFTWTTIAESMLPEFTHTPYAVGIVEIPGYGVRYVGRILADPGSLRIGATVRATFRDVDVRRRSSIGCRRHEPRDFGQHVWVQMYTKCFSRYTLCPTAECATPRADLMLSGRIAVRDANTPNDVR